MPTNGQLVFTDVDKITFKGVGNTSNAVVDTVTGKIGVGIDSPDANLHVLGNTYVSTNLELGGTLIMGTVNVEAQHSLEAITATGNTTPLTVEFSNATTAFKATSNIELTSASKILVDSNVVTEYTGPHDRPLRKYPEVALTVDAETASGYKGYKVTATSVNTGASGARRPFCAFDGDAGTGARTNSGYASTVLNTSSTDYDTSVMTITDTDGTAHLGHWLKLELPKRVRFTRAEFDIYDASYAFKDYVILGSDDDTNWTLLDEATAPDHDFTTHFTSTGYFKYILISIKTVYTNNSTWIINAIKYYGHEEGSGSLDTTLKTVYNVPATTGTQLEVYYDAKDLADGAVSSDVTDLSPNTNNGTVSGDPQISNGAFVFDGTGDYFSSTVTTTTGAGNWPHSYSFWMKADTDASSGAHFVALGTEGGAGSGTSVIRFSDENILWYFWSNDVTFKASNLRGRWVHIVGTYDGGSVDTSRKIFINNVEAPISSSSGIIGSLNLTTTSTPFKVGSQLSNTNTFKGSIANVRLYSKVLSADQIKELYDYQKDFFLGSKSQLTLSNGHLGVGVDKASGQLELAGDERLQEYPPRAMTDYDTHIEGHGVFKVYASGWLDNASFKSWGAFDKNINSVGWHDVNSPYTNGSHTGLSSLAGIKGEWIVLKLPYAINLKSAATAPRTGYTMRAPGAGVILGSNDETNWDQLHSFSGLTATDNTLTYINNITAPGYYTTFALLVTKLAGAPSSTNTNSLNVSEIKFFGTPGPTTLDKGSLSLTQILDVPHVSRYDVDTETPRPEKLILNLDTTVNSTPIDISGKGNHGQFYGNAKYSKEERAFQFDGSSDTIYIDHNGYGVGVKGFPTGDAKYTMSCWMKANEGQTNNAAAVFYFGSAWTTAELAGIYHGVGGKINLDVGARNIATTNQVIFPGRWHHVAIVKRGTGAISTDHSYGSIYIDGEEVTNLTLSGGGNPSQSLNTIDNVSIGSNFNGSAGSFTEAFDGWVAKPQAWNVPLENSEIRKIYNLGHTGRSMMISDTAIGIGKAPEAQLDVRGTGRFQGLGVNTDNLIGALQVHQGPNIPFGGTSATIRDVVPGFVMSSDSAKWAMFINTNDDFIVTSHDSLSGTYTGTTGYIIHGPQDQRMNDFTGQHRCFLRGIPREQIKDKIGLIVSSDKNKYTMISGDIVTGQNAIDISESIPDVSISQKAHDKACFGVISDVEDPEKREDLYGVFGTPFPKEKGDDRVYINSVGEGAIWVANTNGSLEAGDYITTSNVAGYGQKQDSAGLMNYTVAKITMDCDFNPATQPIQVIRKDDNGDNVLDEYGQIQWEDHPTETEKAYKLRYLTVDGTQTDEANAVHTAAFVGCTYHCG